MARPTPWRALVAAFVLVLAACEVNPSNAYDPDAPPENQAAGSVSGKVQAVVSLREGEIIVGAPQEGETLIEAAFCEAREGDHSGFEVVLREISTRAGEVPLIGRATQTNASGGFAFQNIRPGRYSLEVLRPGFDVPAPRVLDVAPGEDLGLAPLCALNETPPERPVLSPLPSVASPALFASDDAPRVEVLGCEAGFAYTVTQVPEGAEGFDASSTTTVLEGDGECVTDLLLTNLSGAPERVTWRVDVVASDSLGNRSAPATAFVVLDDNAPGAPEQLVAEAGLDRLHASWREAPALAGDDSAAGFLVSYSLVRRPEDDGAPCPYGRPDTLAGDDYDTAAFALEGPSPIFVAVPALSLSGILPGTEVFLQLAAVDAVGNISCWSAPLVARPDLVTAALEASDDKTVSAQAAVFFQGLAAYARGSGGMTVLDASGALVTFDSVVASQVAQLGRTFYGAGATGVSVARLPRAGETATVTTLATGDARSVLPRPGLLVVGTPDGVRFLDPADVAGSPAAVDPGGRGGAVVAIASHNEALLLVREGAAPYVQVISRSDPATEVGTSPPLSAVPRALEVAGGKVWLAEGPAGVSAYDLSTCGAFASDCLTQLFRAELPGGASAVDIAAWDELLLVATFGSADDAGDGVLVMQPIPGAAPVIVGRAFAPAGMTLEHVEPRDGGFCATGSRDGGPTRVCWRTVLQPLASPPARFTTGAVVLQATPAEDALWLLERKDESYRVHEMDWLGQTRRLASLPLIDTEDPSFPNGQVILYPGPVVDGVGFASVDSYGRLFALPTAGVGVLERVDADLPATLISEVPALELSSAPGVAWLGNALVDADGDRLVAVVQDQGAGAGCVETTLVTLELVEDAFGALSLGAVDSLTLDDSSRLASLTVDQGVAWIATIPFTLTAVDLDTLTVIDDLGLDPVRGCDASDAQSATAFGVQPVEHDGQRRLLAGGVVDDNGVLVNRLLLLGQGAPTPLVPGGADDVVLIGAVGPWAVVGTGLQGLLVYGLPAAPFAGAQLVPSLGIPSVTQVRHVQATGRGLVVADGPGGVVRAVLR